MAVTGFHHCSFTVTDIEKTIKFYTEILGLKLIRRGEYGKQTLGLSLGLKQPNAKLKTAFMGAGDTQIEFLEYVEPKTQTCPGDPSIAGSGHVAFIVDDIYETKKKLENAEVKITNVDVVEEGELKGWKWCYFRDPNGLTMEIIQGKVIW
jgi:catechol 2,3-dioxygenase-like lactoylglutathione lyase family enzyme